MNLVIDRFESEWVVLGWNGKTFSFPRALLLKRARNGDVVRITCEVDREATQARKQCIRELADELFRD